MPWWENLADSKAADPCQRWRNSGLEHRETTVSEEILHLFDRDPEKLSLAEGDLLFSVGDATNGKMYVLLEGQAEIIVSGYIVELAKPGSIIGELALIDQEPRSGTIRCVTDCSFAEVDESVSCP